MSRRFGIVGLALAFAGAAAAQAEGPTLEQMRRVCSETRATLAKEPPTLTDADFLLLDEIELPPGSITPRDMAALLVPLRFVFGVKDEHVADVATFSLTDEGAALRVPLLFRAVGTKSHDLAARILAALAIGLPKDRRSYGTWKRVETFFGPREDFLRIHHDLTMALLTLFETASEQERDAIADLFSRPGMQNADLPAMRRTAEQDAKAIEEEMQSMWDALDAQDAHLPPVVWIEDRRGLRQVERRTLTRSQRAPVRSEIRFGKAAANDEQMTAWGTLVSSTDDHDGDRLADTHAILRDVAALVGDADGDFVSRCGVIQIFPRKGAESRAKNEPTQPLADAMADVIGETAVVIALASSCPPVAVPAEVRDRAREFLATVRANARSMHDAHNAAVRGDPIPDDLGEHLAPLRAAGKKLQECLPIVRACAIAADTGTFRSMSLAARHTRIHIGADEVRAFAIDESRVEMFAMSRAVLRAATFSLSQSDAMAPGDDRARPAITVTASSLPVPRCFTSDANSSRWEPDVRIACDTVEHATELLAALRQFAAGR